jgi:hypothetical protein
MVWFLNPNQNTSFSLTTNGHCAIALKDFGSFSIMAEPFYMGKEDSGSSVGLVITDLKISWW